MTRPRPVPPYWRDEDVRGVEQADNPFYAMMKLQSGQTLIEWYGALAYYPRFFPQTWIAA